MAKNYMHEDELPEMTDEEYNEWYKTSWIEGGVRVGEIVPDNTDENECILKTLSRKKISKDLS